MADTIRQSDAFAHWADALHLLANPIEVTPLPPPPGPGDDASAWLTAALAAADRLRVDALDPDWRRALSPRLDRLAELTGRRVVELVDNGLAQLVDSIRRAILAGVRCDSSLIIGKDLGPAFCDISHPEDLPGPGLTGAVNLRWLTAGSVVDVLRQRIGPEGAYRVNGDPFAILGPKRRLAYRLADAVKLTAEARRRQVARQAMIDEEYRVKREAEERQLAAQRMADPAYLSKRLAAVEQQLQLATAKE